MATFPGKRSSAIGREIKGPSIRHAKRRIPHFFFPFFFFLPITHLFENGRTKGRKGSLQFPPQEEEQTRNGESRTAKLGVSRLGNSSIVESREFLGRLIPKQVGPLNLTKLQIRSVSPAPETRVISIHGPRFLRFICPTDRQRRYICQRDNLFFRCSITRESARSRKFLVSIRPKEHESMEWRTRSNKQHKEPPLSLSLSLSLSRVTSATLGKYKLYCDFRQGTRIRVSKVHHTRIGLSRCSHTP